MTAAYEDHLNLDAIVAYADGEMPMVAFQRAANHVSRCPQCESEVNQQVLARSWLRAAGTPSMPTSLLDTLRSIPVVVPTSGSGTPGPVDHPVSDDDRAHHRAWRFRFLGAGAIVAGLAVGSLAVAAQPGPTFGPANGHLVSGVTTPFAAPVTFKP